jgi:hypothetical protein
MYRDNPIQPGQKWQRRSRQCVFQFKVDSIENRYYPTFRYLKALWAWIDYVPTYRTRVARIPIHPEDPFVVVSE